MDSTQYIHGINLGLTQYKPPRIIFPHKDSDELLLAVTHYVVGMVSNTDLACNIEITICHGALFQQCALFQGLPDVGTLSGL